MEWSALTAHLKEGSEDLTPPHPPTISHFSSLIGLDIDTELYIYNSSAGMGNFVQRRVRYCLPLPT